MAELRLLYALVDLGSVAVEARARGGTLVGGNIGAYEAVAVAVAELPVQAERTLRLRAPALRAGRAELHAREPHAADDHPNVLPALWRVARIGDLAAVDLERAA